MSFYYWRAGFSPDSMERQAIKDNFVPALYVRYFDVDWSDSDSMPAPASPVHFDSIPGGYRIIPVIFIRNRVFERISASRLPALVEALSGLVRRISDSAHLGTAEVQFDCDWSEKTKEEYFDFLRRYHEQTGSTLSATIRLPQVKYPDRTGIPPVDHGVLMFYNMGNIGAGPGSSIYDRGIAHRYIPSLRSYPLTLDLALPIFAWGLQVRDGKVIRILDRMNGEAFEKDANFIRTGTKGFTARRSATVKGFYFQPNDAVKLESVSSDELFEIVTEVNQHTNHRIRDLIFFDLDSQNLRQYDNHLFKEILDHTE